MNRKTHSYDLKKLRRKKYSLYRKERNYFVFSEYIQVFTKKELNQHKDRFVANGLVKNHNCVHLYLDG